MQAGKKAGVMTALGAFIPEFAYTFIAVYAFTTINNNVEIGQNIQLAGGLGLVGLATFYFFRKVSEIDTLRGTDFSNLVFCDPNWDLWRWKKVFWPATDPRNYPLPGPWIYRNIH